MGNSYIPGRLPIKLEMPLTAIVYLRKKIHVSGKSYYYIHIPAKIGSDSQFPFKEGDKLKMVVQPGKKRIVMTRLAVKKIRKR
ncbi:MAG: hypothetical protein NXY59_07160 [Aigarchaeota archaeon]|nr:hypothetical protein [Candidatus Pelearchaeum maunauluense]